MLQGIQYRAVKVNTVPLLCWILYSVDIVTVLPEPCKPSYICKAAVWNQRWMRAVLYRIMSAHGSLLAEYAGTGEVATYFDGDIDPEHPALLAFLSDRRPDRCFMPAGHSGWSRTRRTTLLRGVAWS